MSVKEKTISGLLWSSVDNVGLNVVRMIITVILARLLEPADFGLIALLTIFISISESMVQGGFTSAMIRKTDVRDDDYSTVFIFNLAVSVLLYAILYATSPLIASFFGQPELNPITKVVALVIIFHSFGIVQNITLRKEINFKSIAIVNLGSTILSGGAGVLMALNGYGVWSLVTQMTSKAFLTSLFLWIFGKWKLSLKFNKASFKSNFNFGYKLTLSDIVNSIANNAYDVVIGKVYSASTLGFFYQARRLSRLSSGIISRVFKSVSFPVLSSLQNDKEKFGRAYLQFLRSAAFISFPLMMLLIVIAAPLITLLLSEKWTDTIPYFQLLCINGMLIPLIVISGNIPVIVGRSDLLLKFTLFYNVQMVIALVITASLGVLAMVIGLVVQMVTHFFINIWFVERLTGIKFKKQLRSLLDIFLISFLSSTVAYILPYLISWNYNILFLQIIIFCTVYLLIQYFIKSSELAEVKKILLEIFSIKNSM